MANPITIASMGLSAAGGIMGAFGKAQEGKAQAQQLQYQAGIAQYNKQVALQNRDYASAQGEEEAVNTGLSGRYREGKIRAGIGASGIDVNSGSAAAVQASQREITQRDMATVRNKAARVAMGYATEAEQAELQSNLYKMGASNVQAATPLNVASSLISGASSVASKWMQAKAAGMV